MFWHLGEINYIGLTLDSAHSVTISGAASCYVYDCADDSIVASGYATVGGGGLDLFFLWQPTVIGVYAAKMVYQIGEEIFSATQIIEVKETM